MYQFLYKDVLEEAPVTARERERLALAHSLELMAAAEKAGPKSREAIEASYFVQSLWSTFIEDLGSPANTLDKELRARLISISIWVLKEAERIRRGEVTSFKAIMDVTETISKGLE